MRFPVFRGWVATLALTSIALLHPAGARAEQTALQREVAAAIALYENLEYERALQQLMQLRPRAQTVDEKVSVALMEGVVHSDLGHPEQSSAAFRDALALDADARLPVQVSPRVVEDFEALRAQARAARSTEPPPSYLPDKALAEAQPRVPRVVPWVLGGVALAAAGTGGVFGLQSNQQVATARRAEFQNETAQALERAEGTARVANVLFAIAGTAAVTAVVTWLLPGHGEERGE